MKPTNNTNAGPQESLDSLMAEVNSFLIDRIENGAPPWAEDSPPRRDTGEPFQGINNLMLGAVKEARGYPSSFWMTEAQARKLGGQVRNEEKTQGAPVLFIKTETREGTGETTVEGRGYRVFNAAQIEGLPEIYYRPSTTEAKPEAVEQMAKGIGLTTAIQEGEAPARYDGKDKVLFTPAYAPENHAAHMGHAARAIAEACQATGKVRTGFKNKDDPTHLHLYTTLSGAFIARHLGGKAATDPTAMQGFARVLRDDPHAIFKMASQADSGAKKLLELTTDHKEAARKERYTAGIDLDAMQAAAAAQQKPIQDKPAFGDGSPENCNASAAYRQKKKEARERFARQMQQEKRPVENAVKRGLVHLLTAADSLTR